PSIHEDEDGVAIQLLHFWLRDKTMGSQLSSSGFLRSLFILILFLDPRRRLRQTDSLEGNSRRQRNQLLERIFAENLVNTVAIACHRSCDEHRVRRVMQLPMLVRMRECVVRNQ